MSEIEKSFNPTLVKILSYSYWLAYMNRGNISLVIQITVNIMIENSNKHIAYKVGYLDLEGSDELEIIASLGCINGSKE